MEVKRCEKGHFYDAEANSSCPQCAAERAAQAAYAPGTEDYGPTEPLPQGNNGVGMTEDYGPTEPQNGGDIGETQPLNGNSGFTEGNFFPNGGGFEVDDYDVTRPSQTSGVAGFSPVVGWLVCVDGPAKGADYRIRSGYNYIGRAEHMDICIKGDLVISRERHAMIAYDQEERIFFFGPADGKSIVRLNGKMVMNPQEIHSHDIITIGSTKLMFVPLCGERFDWNE